MNKKLLVAFLSIGSFFMLPVAGFAQAGGDYIVHTIKRGEVPSVLAKRYNVSLEDLISLNKWGPKVILHVGDKVKLPVGARLSNVADSAKAAAPAANVPAEEQTGRSAPATVVTPAPQQTQVADTNHYILHTIQKGEIPTVLAKKYNVNADEVKRINNWNPHTIWHVGDKVKLPGSAHLADVQEAEKKVSQPAVAATNIQPEVKPAEEPVGKTAPAVTSTPAFQTTYTVLKKETLYSVSKKFGVTVEQLKNWNHLANNNIAEGQSLVIYTKTPVAAPAVVKAPPAKEDNVPALPKQPASVKVAATTTAAQPAAAPAVIKPVIDTANIPAQGFFTPLFGQDAVGKILQTAEGTSMTFKTASGWNDKKYYVLMNDIAPGTIVKVVNAEGKFVFAKILWNMGDAKDNHGLDFMISDAAAAVLGIKETKFKIAIQYYK
jgi:LysM repeat protein